MIGYKQERRLPLEQLYMYQLKPKPPEMPINDCIIQYKQTGDEQYLRYFLHFYESRLNNRAENFCLQQGYLHHFQDIKQAMIEAVLEKIDDYKPDTGASLLTFAHKHIEAAAHEYIRQNCGAISPSEYHYDNLRKIMAIFNSDPNLTEAEKIQTAMENTGLSEEQVYLHLKQSEFFRNPISIDKGTFNEDDGFIPWAEKISDPDSNPETILLKKSLYEALVAEIDSLPYKEKHLLLDYCGLSRYGDWFTRKKPVNPIILAARLHVGTQEAVNENFRNAAAIVRIKLEKAHWIEGKHTPKLSEPTTDELPELSYIDRAIIEYAVRKWRDSGHATEFHILFRDNQDAHGVSSREFLKLWLY